MTHVAYTFRTFPQINLLKEYFPDLYIFGKLKQNIESFCHHIQSEKPNYIIGIANSKTKSVIEPIAINNIHGGKIITKAPETLSLHIPNNFHFPKSSRTANSFCNYSMYKIQYFINQQQLQTQIIFLHLNPKDISSLPKIIEQCQ